MVRQQETFQRAYGVRQAALYLGVSRSMLYKLISMGKLPGIRLGEKKIVIERTTLDEFLEERRKCGGNEGHQQCPSHGM